LLWCGFHVQYHLQSFFPAKINKSVFFVKLTPFCEAFACRVQRIHAKLYFIYLRKCFINFYTISFLDAKKYW
jgi:hypothetical protein